MEHAFLEEDGEYRIVGHQRLEKRCREEKVLKGKKLCVCACEREIMCVEERESACV